MKYCPQCSRPLERKHLGGVERQVCAVNDCGYIHWDNPVPVVAALIQYRDNVVLARNALWPAGVFSLITGYLEKNETAEEAVVREVKEELGLDGKVRDFIGCFSFFAKNQLILAHWLVADGDINLGSEIAEVKLLSRAELERWSFGPLKLTADTVRRWLEMTKSS